MMTRKTAEVLLSILDTVQLPATHPQLVQAAQEIATARAELLTILKESDDEDHG